MSENNAPSDEVLLSVLDRLKSAEVGSDLYVGVEAWPRGAWSVMIPGAGRAIFELWLADFKRAREALRAAPASGSAGGAMREALEIIAGKRQCLDNLMSNQDVALAALSSGAGRDAHMTALREDGK